MNGITTIALDFGGVLVHYIDHEFIRHMAAAAASPVEPFETALWKHRHDFDAGIRSAREYWHAVLQDVLRDSNDTTDTTDTDETIDTLTRLDAAGWSTVRPAMLGWLPTLRQARYRLLIISNMAPEVYDLIIRDSVFLDYFETVILSGWLGINKPDPRIFTTAIERMSVPPEEILFIDDLKANVTGARATGLQALHFTDPATLARDLSTHYPDIPRTGLV